MRAELRSCVLVALAAVVLPQQAAAQTALPVGSMVSATTSQGEPTVYGFAAQSAGVLTVAVQGGGDLVLLAADEDGQPLPEGTSDRDMYGNTGTEMLTVTITEAGSYRVSVQERSGAATASFQIAAGWMPFPPFARQPDPDRRPSTAQALPVGGSHEDSLGAGTGDLWDWYVVTPDQAGTLVVIIRPTGGEPDLILEAFSGGDFGSYVARSDQDLDGVSGNESLTVNVSAGQTVHLKVSGAFSSVEGSYRISSSLIP